jgi:hypothetical protein
MPRRTAARSTACSSATLRTVYLALMPGAGRCPRRGGLRASFKHLAAGVPADAGHAHLIRERWHARDELLGDFAMTGADESYERGDHRRRGESEAFRARCS